MSQTADNTWSSTEAKENSQEISQLVSVHKCVFFYFIIEPLRHVHHCLIFLWIHFFLQMHFRWIIYRWKKMATPNQMMPVLILQSEYWIWKIFRFQRFPNIPQFCLQSGWRQFVAKNHPQRFGRYQIRIGHHPPGSKFTTLLRQNVWRIEIVSWFLYWICPLIEVFADVLLAG